MVAILYALALPESIDMPPTLDALTLMCSASARGSMFVTPAFSSARESTSSDLSSEMLNRV